MVSMEGKNGNAVNIKRGKDVASGMVVHTEVVKDSVSGPKGTTLTDDKGEYFSPTSCLMC